MRKRTLAREVALQALYQQDVHSRAGGLPPDELDAFLRGATDDPEVLRHARILVDGTLASMEGIDEAIAKVAENWKLTRMAPVDRCILRMALFELLEAEDAPPKVVINEAIDLAKKYSTDQSGAFVNGILDSFYRQISKAGGKDDPGA